MENFHWSIWQEMREVQIHLPQIGKHVSLTEYTKQRYSWGGPQNFGRVCCSMGPRKLMFYCFFKWQFLGCVVLWDQIFVEKSPKNSKNFRKFSQKNNVLRFKMVLNGRILMNFDKIAHKTPHKLFLETFQNFENFWEFDPQTPQNSLFIAVLSDNFPKNRENFLKRRLRRHFRALRARKFWPSVLFYGSKKADFVLLGPPPVWTKWWGGDVVTFAVTYILVNND